MRQTPCNTFASQPLSDPCRGTNVVCEIYKLEEDTLACISQKEKEISAPMTRCEAMLRLCLMSGAHEEG